MTSSSYTATLIGSGNVAHRHALAYNKTEGIDLVAATDVNRDQLCNFGEKWDLSATDLYTDHREMCHEVDPDIVSICSPTHLHKTHTLDIVSLSTSPRLIWCEKPIATRLTDAQEMVERCDSEGIELVINHNRRFLEGAHELREIIQNGLLGEIHTINTIWLLELMRNGTHLIDILVYLLGVRADRVITSSLSGKSTVETNAAIPGGFMRNYADSGGSGILIMEDDTLVTIDCTAPRNSSLLIVDILGDSGRLRIDWAREELDYWLFHDGASGERKLTSLHEVPWSDLDHMFKAGASHIKQILDGVEENVSPGEAAVHDLEIIIAMFAGHYTSGSVQLPLVNPMREIEITSW